MTDTFLIDDVLQSGLKIVFCGTALGRTSKQQGAYYAHPRNLFWKTLYETGLTDRQLCPKEFLRLLEFGIGLTDLCKHAFGNDDQLPVDAFDAIALRAKLEKYQPKFLAFTSKAAGRGYRGPKVELGWQPSEPCGTRIYVLPSTSPSARWQWNEARYHWTILADAVRNA